MLPAPLSPMAHYGVWRRTVLTNTSANNTDPTSNSEDSTSYEWRWAGQSCRIEPLQNISKFLEQQQLTLHIMGASHMRYNYDLLAVKIDGKKKKGKQHHTIIEARIYYT
jgi:hypothetical protein